MNTTLKIMSFGGVAVASCFGCTAMAQRIDPPTVGEQAAASLSNAVPNLVESDVLTISPNFQTNTFDDV